MDFAKPAMVMPKHAQPNPAIHAMNGTRSIPHDGGNPKNMATIMGTFP